MAEHFYGVNHTVHISNAGAEELIKGWIGISLNLNPTLPLQKVTHFLEIQLEKKGDGDRSFSLDPNHYYPDIFNSTDNLRALSNIIKEFSYELTKTEPNLKCDISWDDNTRMKWLAKMIELHEIIKNILEQKNIQIEVPQIQLTSSEKELCKYHKAADYYHELCSREKKGGLNLTKAKVLEKKLNYLNELISIVKSEKMKKAELLLYYEDRAETYLGLGNKKDAIEDLKLSMELEDNTGKKILQEYIESLT
jgi:hypothetical protein